MHSPDDTIAAIATATGGAARGIVRISGRDVVQIISHVFRATDSDSVGGSNRASVVRGNVAITCAETCASDLRELPCALYLWPTTRSYTRQPIAELHTFGSPPLLEMLLRTVCTAGARLAAPGVFTLRAFLAGRIDLTQAEAVLGVIDAHDRRQLGVALQQLAGGLSGPLAALRDELLNLLADLEAGLDFTEEDIRFIPAGELQSRLAAAAENVETLLHRMGSRGRSEIEPQVVLIGWPNVGKSSLFNALLDRPAALVSSSPGTTRDYLTATLVLGEISCRLIDTAGRDLYSYDPQDGEAIAPSLPSPLRGRGAGGEGEIDEPANHSANPLTAAAQRATLEQTNQADLRLICLDSTREPNAWEKTQLVAAKNALVVLTKCDIPESRAPTLPSSVHTSSRTGTGLAELKSAIHNRITTAGNSDAMVATAARCGDSLRLATDCLHRASQIAGASAGEELIASEMRAALAELGKIVGTIYTDDILDRIFSRFCIGK